MMGQIMRGDLANLAPLAGLMVLLILTNQSLDSFASARTIQDTDGGSFQRDSIGAADLISASAPSQRGPQAAQDALLPGNAIIRDQQQQQQAEQADSIQAAAAAAAAPDDRAESDNNNFHRFILKDIDLDGSSGGGGGGGGDGPQRLQPTSEQWKMVRINELLEALSGLAPPTNPIYRSGRTSLSAVEPTPIKQPYNRYSIQFQAQDGAGQLQPQPQQLQPRRASKQQLLEMPQQQQQQQQNDGSGPAPAGSRSRVGTPLIGLAWPQQALGRPGRYSGIGGPAGAVSRPGARRGHPNPHHSTGTEEVAINTPLRSRSISDYEWKRVENTRSWNNLRGMWGKRSVSMADFEQPADSELAGGEDGSASGQKDAKAAAGERKPQGNGLRFTTADAAAKLSITKRASDGGAAANAAAAAAMGQQPAATVIMSGHTIAGPIYGGRANWM